MRTAKALLSLTLIAGLGLSVTGCTTADVPDAVSLTGNSATSDQSDAQTSIGVTDPSKVQLPAGSNALGVVTASLLIATGDISKAVSDGQVTPSEVKYAVMAIQDGTLDLWKKRAEQEQGE